MPKKINLRVIPKPDETKRTILASDNPNEPLMQGDGEVNLRCGSCMSVLARRVDGTSSIQGIVFQCPKCKAYNDTLNPAN
jgi:phage FluMu protein Com